MACGVDGSAKHRCHEVLTATVCCNVGVQVQLVGQRRVASTRR